MKTNIPYCAIATVAIKIHCFQLAKLDFHRRNHQNVHRYAPAVDSAPMFQFLQ